MFNFLAYVHKFMRESKAFSDMYTICIVTEDTYSNGNGSTTILRTYLIKIKVEKFT